jgi:tRNA pseudouridine38-40 synthase
MEGNLESYESRQEEVADFWKKTEGEYIKPILEKLDPVLRSDVMAAIHTDDALESLDTEKKLGEEPTILTINPESRNDQMDNGARIDPAVIPESNTKAEVDAPEPSPGLTSSVGQKTPKTLTPLEAAIKEVKAAYIKAKKAYRISSSRRERVQEALSAYLGTRNFHNYTIQKNFKDDSAKRVIRSFSVNPNPVYVNDTEWLSLKVHGQSFMMHQIRKMVAMAALIVRCGCPIERINESYENHKISIPKAPGLGLLLERPVFDSYNKRAVEELQREKIDFTKYEAEINEFKQREIYERIYREEEKENQYVVHPVFDF